MLRSMSSADLQVCILNYKKNGESFWNHFYLEPIFDDSGVVEYYIGMATHALVL